MTSVPVKVQVKKALFGLSLLGPSLAGCGDSLQDTPENAPYVAPPSPGEMKPPPKQKGGRPKMGVPLSLRPAAAPVIALAAPSPA